MQTPRLQLQGITKHYPGVRANDGVDLVVMPGQIHALLGENGAGKSTLMKIIYGAVQADAGQMLFNGQPVHVRNPQEARALGVAMVFQHFSLFNTATVAENVWMGLPASQPLREVRQRITDISAQYGLEVDPDQPVHGLSVGEMQRVEIIRALLTQPQLLILDEPTSVLTPQAVDKLFVVLRQLASEGCSIVYISHKLHEIRALCHVCTVLRGGRVTGVCDPSSEDNASLSRMMIGSEPRALQHGAARPGAVRLQLDQLDVPSPEPFGVDLKQVSLNLSAGEVVGIAGVSGNGQKALFAALSGEDLRVPKGSLRLDGRDLRGQGPQQRRALGLHCVPEERLGRGAVPALSLAQNLLLTRREAIRWPWLGGGWIAGDVLSTMAAGIIARFGVRAPGPQARAGALSGGNLQKFIVGREISAEPQVLVLAQPTWGVDVGAAAQIRSEILALRDAGGAVLVISEELDELFEVCDRLHVLARGYLSPSIPVGEADAQTIGQWMSGLWDDDVQAHLQALGQSTDKESHAAA
jgi:ABC-type uncharacterized transport system ATPase subunit